MGTLTEFVSSNANSTFLVVEQARPKPTPAGAVVEVQALPGRRQQMMDKGRRRCVQS
jgi:hypothetical protein